jgi:hypothetical protein
MLPHIVKSALDSCIRLYHPSIYTEIISSAKYEYPEGHVPLRTPFKRPCGKTPVDVIMVIEKDARICANIQQVKNKIISGLNAAKGQNTRFGLVQKVNNVTSLLIPFTVYYPF